MSSIEYLAPDDQQTWFVSGLPAGKLPYIVHQPPYTRQRYPFLSHGGFVIRYGEKINEPDDDEDEDEDEDSWDRPPAPIIVSSDYVMSLWGPPEFWPDIPQGQFVSVRPFRDVLMVSSHSLADHDRKDCRPFTLAEERMEEYAWKLVEHFGRWESTLQPDGTRKYVWPVGSGKGGYGGVKAYVRSMRRVSYP